MSSRGKLLKILRLPPLAGAHNAEVEGSSPSLTTKINELQPLSCGISSVVAHGFNIYAGRARNVTNCELGIRHT